MINKEEVRKEELSIDAEERLIRHRWFTITPRHLVRTGGGLGPHYERIDMCDNCGCERTTIWYRGDIWLDYVRNKIFYGRYAPKCI